MAKLKDQVALVTGAGRGIGAVYAKALSEAGAKVVVSDVLDTGHTVDDIKQAGGTAIGTACDVTDPAQVRTMVDRAVSAYGRIDVLVTNASLFASLTMKPFTEIDEAEWDRVMTTNVRGVFTCAKAVVPVMRDQGRGKIINIASGTVFKGTPNMLHYVTSKGATIALTRSMARELGADGIQVNAIAPGLVMSEAVEIQPQWQATKDANAATRAIVRDMVPDDLIGTLLFLASSGSDFITGQTIVCDGGSVMH